MSIHKKMPSQFTVTKIVAFRGWLDLNNAGNNCFKIKFLVVLIISLACKFHRPKLLF